MNIRIVVLQIILILSMANSTVAASEDSELVIVESNRAKAYILIDNDASTQLKTAVNLLQNYIKKSTGVSLEIRNTPRKELITIHVGRSRFSDSFSLDQQKLVQDGFILKRIDFRNFIILGDTDWGTEFGIYEFLERYVGVRWLFPTANGIDIPSRSNVIIDNSSIVVSPKFLSRNLSPIGISDKTDVGNWGRYNRLKPNIEFHHNLSRLFDVTQLKAYPQYFSTYSVNRKIPTKDDKYWQPNFSAKGIVDVAADRIIDYFQKNPSKRSYSLGINDNKNFDQSEDSKNRRTGRRNILGLEDVSDDYFLWANLVVKKVSQRFPDKTYGMLAYHNLLEPPTNKVGVDKNIIPFITNERLRWSDASFRAYDIDLTTRWVNSTTSVGWYDYAYGNTYLIPRVWFHVMQEYLEWGYANGVKYYYAELYPNWGEGPKAWILAKLLWDPNQDVDLLLDDWYIRVAGSEGSLKLKEYYSIWEKYWEVDVKRSKWYNTRDQFLLFRDLGYMSEVSMNMVNKSDQLLNEAHALAETDLQRQRINEIRKMWNIYKLGILAYRTNNFKKYSDLINDKNLIKELNRLKDDPLHGPIIRRMISEIHR